jgi:2-deoxy-D-gluconate 3-dehydrogenase
VADSATDLFRIDGKVALVTGASRGLGAGIAMALARAGARVALHASEQLPRETAATIAAAGFGAAQMFAADLSQPDAAERLFAEVVQTCGAVDILVNNAGIIRRASAVDYTDDDWDVVMQVNLSSVFRLCRAAARHLLDRGAPGKIVNIASLLSFQGGVRVPAYAAAKGGLAQLTKALANEWAAHRINVNAVAPGYMETDNTRALRDDATRSRQILERIPAGRWGRPDDLDGAVVFLASRASDYVHGHVLAVDGGWLGR